jgi:hypothetical protein
MPADDATSRGWQGNFPTAEETRRKAALCATPAERLRWLEEALEFAARVGALTRERRDPNQSPPTS